jgi:predicted dehydrogenase
VTVTLTVVTFMLSTASARAEICVLQPEATVQATRAALIGTGYIAREHLRCLRTLPGVEVVAVCDRSPALAEAVAEEFGVPRHFTDAAQLLSDIQPDFVHVTTPPQSHVPLARLALDAGCHVIVEKPLALSRAEALGLLQLAEERGRWLVEDHNYLFNPAVQRLLAAKRSGQLGQCVHVEVLFAVQALGPGSRHGDPAAPESLVALPGGAVLDFITHLAYLACAFAGSAQSATTDWRRASEDASTWSEFRALVRGAEGSAALAWSASAQPDTFALRVHGSRQRGSASLFEPLLVIERLADGPRPLVPVRNGLAAAGAYAHSAVLGLWRKLQGRPVTYAGLWELLARLYAAQRRGEPCPLPAAAQRTANELVWMLLEQEPRA